MYSKIKPVIREGVVAIVGAIIGVALTHVIVRRAAQGWAWAALATAGQYQKAGDDDRAILLLAQATATDPEFYASFELLGDIYSKRKNQQMALEMYKKALDVFDQEQFLPPGEINASEKELIRSKVAALNKQRLSQQHAVQPRNDSRSAHVEKLVRF